MKTIAKISVILSGVIGVIKVLLPIFDQIASIVPALQSARDWFRTRVEGAGRDAAAVINRNSPALDKMQRFGMDLSAAGTALASLCQDAKYHAGEADETPNFLTLEEAHELGDRFAACADAFILAAKHLAEARSDIDNLLGEPVKVAALARADPSRGPGSVA